MKPANDTSATDGSGVCWSVLFLSCKLHERCFNTYWNNPFSPETVLWNKSSLDDLFPCIFFCMFTC